MPPSNPSTASSSKPKPKSKSVAKAKGSGPKPNKGKTVPPTSNSATDIDSIFAKPAVAVAGPSKVTKEKKRTAVDAVNEDHKDGGGSSGSKKKKKKAKTAAEPESVTEPAKENRGRVVEVVDTSIPKVKPPPAPPTATAASASGKGKDKKAAKQAAEEDEIFADSRGTGPRRKTEEGYIIYKEAELQIDPEAGGTPLCPFDCECCY